MSAASPLPTDVLRAFERVDDAKRNPLLATREMIFEVAQSRPDLGPIEETLRWGEPAYVSTQKKTGSTIRLGVEKTTGKPALFFNCRTTLVEEFRAQFGTSLTFVKNRAILLDGNLGAKTETLKMCIDAALRYHMRANPRQSLNAVAK